MDKELLRIVIILTGVLVMIGMILWHFIKALRDQREHEELNETDYHDNSFTGEESDHDDAYLTEDVFVDGDALLDNNALNPVKKETPAQSTSVKTDKPVTQPVSDLPKLIEFSLVARDDQGFNGGHLYETFERLGLEYGSKVKVFERVDENRLVHFTVASQTNTGTFPESNPEQFYCSGIIFFLQPREVEHPLRIFDDLMETIDILALELDGVVLDKRKQPLTAETIANLRQQLVVAKRS